MGAWARAEGCRPLPSRGPARRGVRATRLTTGSCRSPSSTACLRCSSIEFGVPFQFVDPGQGKRDTGPSGCRLAAAPSNPRASANRDRSPREASQIRYVAVPYIPSGPFPSIWRIPFKSSCIPASSLSLSAASNWSNRTDNSVGRNAATSPRAGRRLRSGRLASTQRPARSSRLDRLAKSSLFRQPAVQDRERLICGFVLGDAQAGDPQFDRVAELPLRSSRMLLASISRFGSARVANTAPLPA